MNRTLLALLLVLPACVIDPSGYLIGAPVGVTTTEQPAIGVKIPGFDPPGGLPPFDKLPARILSGAGITVPPGVSPIRAMSMGLEVLFIEKGPLHETDTLDGVSPPATTNAVILHVGSHGWAAIGFTVDSAALAGEPLGGDVALTPLEELDRTIFNYFLPRSVVESVPMESSPRIAMRPEDLGLLENDAIHGLDMHMGLHLTDLADYAHIFTSRPLTDTPWVYFTLHPDLLTPEVVGPLSSHWGITVDTATIYMTKWTGSDWSKPTIYRTRGDLGLPADPGIEIDALAIDAVQPGVVRPEDEILFSLAGSIGDFTGPENQVLFATPETPTTHPPRVVIRHPFPSGDYGSLGTQLGAGVALGDICTADPFGSDNPSLLKPLLDEFFVARRMPPLPPFNIGGFSIPRPKPALAIAAYRRLVTYSQGGKVILEVPRLRTCMSWPRHCKNVTGEALVVWGHVNDHRHYPGSAENWQQVGSCPLTYTGEPLVFEVDLPKDGLLQPLGAPPPGEKGMQAYYVQWFLEVDGEVMRSPVAMLRY